MAPEITHRQIKEEIIGQTGKRVLVVEGTTDKTLFFLWLQRKFGANWENSWVICGAGKKKAVLDIIEKEPSWVGIVDRDEWRQNVIENKQEKLNNLFVLPRFCIENYAVDPDELWDALPDYQKEKVSDGLHSLRTEILKDKDKWLRHGVLWSIVNPLWSGLRSLGFKEKLLDFKSAQDDEIIKQTLNEWHRYLDPDILFNKFEKNLRDVQKLPTKVQLARWIHGKLFFREKVHPILNKYLGQSNVESRLRDIFKTLKLPEDLKPLWERIHP